jgi:hypothetical protein
MPHAAPERRRRPRRPTRTHHLALLSAVDRERRIAAMIREALWVLEAERRAAPRYRNPDDDEESSTELGVIKKRQ